MSRNRRVKSSDDSLELLLDTICNTFGGIIFMALLVSVLSGQASNEVALASVEKGKQAELERLSVELSEELQNLEQLRTANNLISRISQSIDNPKLKKLLIQKENLQNAIMRLDNQLSKEIIELSKDQSEVNIRSNELTRKQKMLENSKNELSQLELELQQTEKNNARVFGFPIVQLTEKKQFSIAIKNNRICFFERFTSNGLEDDPDQVTKTGNGFLGFKFIPRFENGINFNSNSISVIKKIIDKFDPDRFHATIFVWDDSIEAFQKVTELLLLKEIKYEVLVMTENDVISSGNIPRLVQ